jgi:hypothetical protein
MATIKQIFGEADARAAVAPVVATVLDILLPGAWERAVAELVERGVRLPKFPRNLATFLEANSFPTAPIAPEPANWVERPGEPGRVVPTDRFVQSMRTAVEQLDRFLMTPTAPTLSIDWLLWLVEADCFVGAYIREPRPLLPGDAAAMDSLERSLIANAAALEHWAPGSSAAPPGVGVPSPRKGKRPEAVGFVPSVKGEEEEEEEKKRIVPIVIPVPAPAAAPPVPPPPPPPPLEPPEPPAPPQRAVPGADFMRGLNAIVREKHRMPNDYRWPNTLDLPETEQQDLWVRLTDENGWFDSQSGRREVDVRTEVEHVFGQAPYYFLKPWVRPDLRFPLRWADQRDRAPHAYVDPGYRAMRPGPNIAHFTPEFLDELGRGYCLGTESTSDLPVLYYKRGPRGTNHPARGDVLLLRHVSPLRHPRPCRGHRVEVERTRILPRAATGVVCLLEYSGLYQCV